MSAEFRRHLRANPIIAILRATHPAPLDACIETLVEAGIRTLEVTLPTPGAVEAVRAASEKYGSAVWIGSGTVLTADEASRAADAGARFIVSPHTDPELIAAATARGLASLPGAGTVTEALSAWRAGASAVKLFPARTLGSSFVSDMAAPLPEVPLVAVGGVGLTDAAAYLEAGALAVGVGSPLIGDALTAPGAWSDLAARARRFIDATRRAS